MTALLLRVIFVTRNSGDSKRCDRASEHHQVVDNNDELKKKWIYQVVLSSSSSWQFVDLSSYFLFFFLCDVVAAVVAITGVTNVLWKRRCVPRKFTYQFEGDGDSGK